MKSYPEYKDTSIDWLGTIPSHWGTVPLKYVCYMKGRIGWQGLTQAEFTNDGPYLITGMNFKNGKMNWDECYHISEERYAEAPEIHVREGDVLITKDGTIGKLLYMDYLPGPTSLNSHLLILRPRKEEFVPKYLYYLLHSDAFLRYVDNVKTGTTFFGITQASMGDFRMLIFDKAEQAAIAEFLDCKTAQIDTLIEKKQRQIDLLQEQRTALINHAVTKGLNPDAPMKDSGVEWLGEIPRHWQVVRIKHLAESMLSGPFGSSLTKDMYTSEGYRVYGQEQVIPADFSIGDYYISEEKYNEMQRYAVSTGDVLISCVGTFGKIAVVPDGIEPGVINPRLIKVSPNRNVIVPEYLGEVLSSKVTFDQLEEVNRGGTMGVINLGLLSDILIPVPPIDEQIEIKSFVDTTRANVSRSQQNIVRMLELLTEYRTALISEAVTGKIDVRGQ